MNLSRLADMDRFVIRRLAAPPPKDPATDGEALNREETAKLRKRWPKSLALMHPRRSTQQDSHRWSRSGVRRCGRMSVPQ